MHISEFLRTIYLGDRACKGLIIDTWNRRVKLQVDVISRVRDASEEWRFYVDEDITDGFIVFEDVIVLRFDPAGPLPNDYINGIVAERVGSEDDDVWKITILISSVDDEGTSTEIMVTVLAKDCYLEDPEKPGEEVR